MGRIFGSLAQKLAQRSGAANVPRGGVDTVNVGDVQDRSRPAHTILLAAVIPIVGSLRSHDPMLSSGFSFSAVPARVATFSAFPGRADAVVWMRVIDWSMVYPWGWCQGADSNC